MTARDLYWGAVAVLAAALLGGPVGAAAYSAYVVSRVDVTDWSLVRDDVAAADATTMTYAATADMSAARKPVVNVQARFAGGSDYVIVRPVFYDADLAISHVGALSTLSAGVQLDDDGLYPSTTIGEWYSGGGVYCIAWVTSISGTADIWMGTR